IIFSVIWMIHYVQRTFIFPFLIRGKSKMPIAIMSFGFIFNLVNTYLQAKWIFKFSPLYKVSWIITPFFISGIIIFFSGYLINIQSDYIIRNLRDPGEKRHKIPKGGFYKYISCPNYFGEITEWIGWAIMLWCIPGLLFAFWTIANLAPRALSNHEWYKNEFPNYPKERKALIPFLL
ncbi:MAG: 3-oxo-5-alpha-steroid 4-dehydrogenase, partial [Candidatus Lokiarchaeota archaeon]